MRTARSIVDALNDALPQTQCTRCGFADCHGYAEAIADGSAGIDRCPPGGGEGIARLAALTGSEPKPLDPMRGLEGPRQLAVIDEAGCIGCTLCLQACPVDCIVGGPKAMHTVIDELCTGCELCIPACPVDCIALIPVTGTRTGWQAWSAAQAHEARRRYALHTMRLERDASEQADRLESAAPREPATHVPVTALDAADEASPATRRQAVIEGALARARAARGQR